MSCCRLGLAAIVTFCVVAGWGPTARAESLAGLRAVEAGAAGTSTVMRAGLFHHGKRVQSSYCYPRNYWWFYRPYTTATQNYPRCMPYFHYLDEGSYRGKPDRLAK